MTTPNTMTTSMITTATTMMTIVVAAPSLGGLLVGCVLLLTGTVPVMVVVPKVCEGEGIPTVWGRQVVPTVRRGEDTLTVWKGMVDAVGWKHTTHTEI